MKKSFILKTSVITLALIILMQVSTFAYNITLNLSTDNSKYDVNKEVTLTVKWGEKQQAAGFTINYDSSKVKFESSPDITGVFYNANETGKIVVNWASMDGNDLTQMRFKFTTIAEGDAEFSITNTDTNKFATGDLEYPESVNASNAKVKITVAKTTEIVPDGGNNDQVPSGGDDGETGQPDGNNSGTEQTGGGNGGTASSEDEASDKGDGKEETPTTSTPTVPGQSEPSTSSKKDDTTADEPMPQTGAESTILFVIGTVALIGIIGLKKYRKLSDI